MGGGHNIMRKSFTLEYWRDEEWFVGRLQEVPGVFSQGETLEELEQNIRDAYELVASDQAPPKTSHETHCKEIEVEV
jgi:predicted RNase H-like HicB family nuclease